MKFDHPGNPASGAASPSPNRETHSVSPGSSPSAPSSPSPVSRSSGAVGETIALSQLAPDRAAVIVSVDSNAAAGRRLSDLGFLPGTAIRVIRRAPLGDPIEFELRGYNLCLRRAEAGIVRVRVE